MGLTEEHDAFRAMVRAYVENEIDPHIDEWEAAEMMPLHQIFSDMAKLGMLGLEYEPEYGGQGAGHLYTVILAEEFGRCGNGSLPMALGVQVDMATPSLARFGTPEQKRLGYGPVELRRLPRACGQHDRRDRSRLPTADGAVRRRTNVGCIHHGGGVRASTRTDGCIPS